MNILFIDSTQVYPYGYSAANTKMGLIARGLTLEGEKVSIIDSIKGVKLKNDMPYDGNINNVTYNIFEKTGLSGFLSNIGKLNRILKQRRQSDDLNVAILSSPNVVLYAIYLILLKLNRYKVAVIFHEWHIAYNDNTFLRAISNYIYDYTFGYFCSVIFPISTFLENKCLKFGKKMMKVPILADFQDNQFSKRGRDLGDKKFFLYCGNTGYFRVIKILIDAFNQLKEESDTYLSLVLYGNKEDEEQIIDYISSLGLKERVIIHKNLSYSDLYAQYEQALALLIPLSPDSLQDKARFSQKIAEYLSSKRPIITVGVGDVNYYFTDKENAFVSKDLSVDELFQQMKFVVENRDIADSVGQKGYELGVSEFDYVINSRKIKSFLYSNLS